MGAVTMYRWQHKILGGSLVINYGIELLITHSFLPTTTTIVNVLPVPVLWLRFVLLVGFLPRLFRRGRWFARGGVCDQFVDLQQHIANQVGMLLDSSKKVRDRRPVRRFFASVEPAQVGQLALRVLQLATQPRHGGETAGADGQAAAVPQV